MTGKAPLSPTLSIVPQLRLPGSRRVVQERVSLRVPQIPREAGNRHIGDAPISGLGSFSLPRPHLSSLTPPTPSPLPPPAPARAPPVPCPPPAGCQSQLPAVPWLPKQRSRSFGHAPWRCFPPFAPFVQSLASECSPVPASPSPPSRRPAPFRKHGGVT